MFEAEPRSGIIVSFQNVTLRVRDRLILPDTDWTIREGEHWAVVGPNGSGKSTLVRCFVDQYPVAAGRIIHTMGGTLSSHVGFVSFDQHRRIVAADEDRDYSRTYSGTFGGYLTAADLIGAEHLPTGRQGHPLEEILSVLAVEPLLTTAVRHLSTGEMRRVLIARALLGNPEILVLDEPFDGLDLDSRPVLVEALDALAGKDIQIVLVTHHYEEIAPCITHVLCLRHGLPVLSGPKEEVLASPEFIGLYPAAAAPFLGRRHRGERSTALLVSMRDVTVRFGGSSIFEHLNWEMATGQNWQILGPNGSGKSTLLEMITGENPQVFSNEVYLFGVRRGRGDSLWDVKRRIGVVSSELQLRYRKPIPGFEVILSGFYESIGMYRRPTGDQVAEARRWVDSLGLGGLADRRFDRLSFGEQRLILIARAMIKGPDLLLLDEPCQGLDPGNRAMILEAVERIGSETSTALIYVTHHRDETVPSLTHRLTFYRGSNGIYTTRGERLRSSIDDAPERRDQRR